MLSKAEIEVPQWSVLGPVLFVFILMNCHHQCMWICNSVCWWYKTKFSSRFGTKLVIKGFYRSQWHRLVLCWKLFINQSIEAKYIYFSRKWFKSDTKCHLRYIYLYVYLKKFIQQSFYQLIDYKLNWNYHISNIS